MPFEQYGSLLGSLGFTGEMTDRSGLQYLRARYYSPSLGIFLSADPVQGILGGSSIRWNSYIYAGANPVNYIDPSGRLFWLGILGVALIVGAIGVGYGAVRSALEWDTAHRCGCGPDSVLNSDRTQYILNGMFRNGIIGAGIGAMIAVAPVVALPLAVFGLVGSGAQIAQYWNPKDPYEKLQRGIGIFDFLTILATLPFAARASSDAWLNGALRWRAGTDPLFHPDVVYPGIQRGFVGRMAEGTLACFGAYPRAVSSAQTGNKKVVLELFSGPKSQIDRDVAGYGHNEANILTVDIKTYGNPEIIRGSATDLWFLKSGSVDEVFLTNPFNEGLRGAGPEAMQQFKLAVYQEAARVLKPSGDLIINFAGNNKYGKVLNSTGALRSEIGNLGFNLLSPFEPLSPNSTYSKLHPALWGASFGRPDGNVSLTWTANNMRTIILRRGG